MKFSQKSWTLVLLFLAITVFFYLQHCERIHVQFEEIIVNESEMAKLNELKDIMAREAMKV